MGAVFAHLVRDELRPIGAPTLADRAYRAPLAQGVEVHIRTFTFSEPRPRDRYECLLVRPVHKGQRQFVRLQQKGTSKRLGYLFPLAALAEDSEMEGWAAKYAHVAVESLLETEIASGHMAISGIEEIARPEGTSITEIFDPDLGIVVLGKENLTDAGCDLQAVRLMIQEYGIRTLSARSPEPTPSVTPPFEEGINIRQCSSDVRDDLGQFCFLIEIAEQQRYLPARFLILYQIVEALISRLYENAVRAIVTDPTLLQNIWDMRDELEKISSEKSRINKLLNEYVHPKPLGFPEATAEVRNACLAFLLKADPTDTLLPPQPNDPETNASLVPGALTAASGSASPQLTQAADQPGTTPATPAVTTGTESEEAPAPTASGTIPAAAAPLPSPAETALFAPQQIEVTGPDVAEEGIKPQPGKVDLSNKVWSEILYRSRNLVVHRQWQMKVIPEKELAEVCTTLERLYFLSLSNFVADPKRLTTGEASEDPASHE